MSKPGMYIVPVFMFGLASGLCVAVVAFVLGLAIGYLAP